MQTVVLPTHGGSMTFSSISSGAVEEPSRAVEILVTLLKGLRISLNTGTQKSSTRLVYWLLQNLLKYVKA